MCPKRWIVATRNSHKLEEIYAIVGNSFMLDILPDDFPPIEEPFSTISANAWAKAYKAWQILKNPVVAEDTGMEIEALDGKPGVHTARYGGQHLSMKERRQLILKQLEGHTNRNAQFRTVLVAIINGVPHFFEGIVKGKIAYQESGSGGFGYDPIFIPEGYDKTFAELPAQIKNLISHRARALQKFIGFCKKISNP